MNEIDIVIKRLPAEEGIRKFAYDDSTGKQVTCKPLGNLTIGCGLNLEVGFDDEDIEWHLRKSVSKVAAALSGYDWYKKCDPVRKSVLLDVAFNQGVNGLLHYAHMLSAILKSDWESAAAECGVSDPKLDSSRYAPLRKLMLVGGNG